MPDAPASGKNPYSPEPSLQSACTPSAAATHTCVSNSEVMRRAPAGASNRALTAEPSLVRRATAPPASSTGSAPTDAASSTASALGAWLVTSGETTAPPEKKALSEKTCDERHAPVPG